MGACALLLLACLLLTVAAKQQESAPHAVLKGEVLGFGELEVHQVYCI